MFEVEYTFPSRRWERGKASLEYVANAPIDLTDEQMEKVDTLIDKLEEDDDVQHVYTNIN